VDRQEAQQEKLATYRDSSLARNYDGRWSGLRGPGRDRRKQRAILAALESLGAATSVLDVPCGTGRFAAFLRARGMTYLGMDAAAAMLGEAARKHAGVPFFQADLARLPLSDESVDLVVCIRLMHLVRGPELRVAFLREMARVARVGVIVDFRHSASLRVVLGQLRHRIGLRRKAPNAQTVDELRALLTDAGLETTQVVYVRSFPWISDKIVFAARKKS
jgi:ubiquinone/menaquinone biosynthesis C-methylase UbiE